MTPERFRELIDAYGGAPEAWPAPERAAALAFARSDARAGAMLAEAKRLDALIGAMKLDPPAIDTARIVSAALSHAQEPAAGNVAQFAPRRTTLRPVMVWARGAALAAATVAGFVIGMSDQSGGLGEASALDLLDQVQLEDTIW
jgi:hypothetical protein